MGVDLGTASGASPMVTVVIPSFNHARFIRDTIDSVLAQTFRDFELIVVDDGSTDGSPEIIQRHLSAHPHASLARLRLQVNRGVIPTLNSALAEARGRYFAALGSDDLWEPNKLEVQVRALEADGDAHACYSDCWVIDAEGQRRDRLGRQYPYRGGWIFDHLIAMDFMPPSPTTVFRTATIRNLGGYNEHRRITEDVDLWLRLTRRHRVLYLDEVLSSYRVHGDNVSWKRSEALIADIRESLHDALGADAGRRTVARLEARLLAREAAYHYNALRFNEARRAAMRAVRLRPWDRAALTVLTRSALGTRVVSSLRARRREAIARAVSEAPAVGTVARRGGDHP